MKHLICSWKEPLSAHVNCQKMKTINYALRRCVIYLVKDRIAQSASDQRSEFWNAIMRNVVVDAESARLQVNWIVKVTPEKYGKIGNCLRRMWPLFTNFKHINETHLFTHSLEVRYCSRLSYQSILSLAYRPCECRCVCACMWVLCVLRARRGISSGGGEPTCPSYARAK